MDMNERVEKLEVLAEKTSDRLYALEQDIAIIKATGATKTDIAELRAELRTEFRSSIAELRSDLVSAIAQAKSSIVLWVVSAVFLAQLLPWLLNRLGV